MPNIKSSITKYIFVAFSLCFVFTASFAASESVSDKLKKGKELYEQGKYDDAMDKFIDVFVSGNSEQISEANEYVNKIHFKRGGVEAPKQVPYDEELEKTRTSGHEGKVLFDSRKNREGIEDERPVASAAQQQTAKTAQAKKPVAVAAKSGAYAEENAAAYEAEEEQNNIVEPTIYTPDGGRLVEKSETEEKIIPSSTIPDVDDEEVKALRRDSINAQVDSMINSVLETLNVHDGVNVYMRSGMVDAIDIESSAIFADDGITFKPEAKDILDKVYSLMILNGTPSFVLLPPGSYTDSVSIQGVRQTVALNSYLINMGISTAKLNFNMGLTTEQPPAKFSNLEGISIVFDYTAKPNLKLKSPEKNIPPVLSLGLYPFRTINPEQNEGMVVDFSVVQSFAKVADWSLQIIHHAKDGKYYVVRQISGEGAVYRQIFWNGKKQYFGQILPIGNYTIILKAKDVDGREKIVRRKVELTQNKKAVVKTAKSAKTAQAEAEKLDYSIKRLWTKPSATRKSGAAAASAEDDFATEQPASEPADDFSAGSYGGNQDFELNNGVDNNFDQDASFGGVATTNNDDFADDMGY